LGHDLAQEGDAVHARHLDVQRDNVRHFLLNAAGRGEGISGRSHDLDLGVGLQDLGHRLADQG
jgi:hypothetical protein